MIFPGKPNFRDSEHLISRGWTDSFKLRAGLIIWKKENGIRLERSDTLENEFQAASNAAFRYIIRVRRWKARINHNEEAKPYDCY